MIQRTTPESSSSGCTTTRSGPAESSPRESIWLREILSREDGPPPPVDLTHEKVVGDFVRSLIHERLATAVHDMTQQF